MWFVSGGLVLFAFAELILPALHNPDLRLLCLLHGFDRAIPGPGEPGNDTWPGDTWRNGGGSTWTTGAYDPELNLVYWNTGNAGPWNLPRTQGR